VCKIMDYGKFKYEAAVKMREARKNQAHTVIKEMKLRQFKISMTMEPDADVRGWEGLGELRTPSDPLNRGALEGARIITVPPAGAKVEPTAAPTTDAPALTNPETGNTNSNETGAATEPNTQAGAPETPSNENEVKP